MDPNAGEDEEKLATVVASSQVSHQTDLVVEEQPQSQLHQQTKDDEEKFNANSSKTEIKDI